MKWKKMFIKNHDVESTLGDVLVVSEIKNNIIGRYKHSVCGWGAGVWKYRLITTWTNVAQHVHRMTVQ